MTQRKLKNWLKAFMEYSTPVTEASELFLLWSGLFTIAAALRRRCWIPKDDKHGRALLGGWECYPFLYLILVGPPGVRKTTAVRFATNLLHEIPSIKEAPGSPSSAGLALFLTEVPDASAYIVSEEMSDLFAKSDARKMYELLTSFFDGKKKYSGYTISREMEFATSPCINLAAGTTPIWIKENFPVEIIGGGFASRCIFLYDETKSKSKILYDDVDYKPIIELEKDLLHDLQYIAINEKFEGPFDIESKCRIRIKDWYKEHENKVHTYHPKIQGYLARKPVHLLKVAMLCHVCYDDDLVITEKDFEIALKYIEQTEKGLDKIFGVIGRNTYTIDTREIYNYIRLQKKVSRAQLLTMFESVATLDVIDMLLRSLIEQKKIVSVYEKTVNDIIYSLS